MKRRQFLGLTALAAVAPVLTEKIICGIDWGFGPDRTLITYAARDAANTLKLIGVTTGRFSCSQPNLSNIPREG